MSQSPTANPTPVFLRFCWSLDGSAVVSFQWRGPWKRTKNDFCLCLKCFSGFNSVVCLWGDFWCVDDFHLCACFFGECLFIVYVKLLCLWISVLFLSTVGTCGVFDVINICFDFLFCCVLLVKRRTLGKGVYSFSALVIHFQLKDWFVLSFVSCEYCGCH